MKKHMLIFALLALSFAMFAQPTAITWQGKLLDNSGNAITQNNVAMTFAMFDAQTAGTQLWPASGVVTKTVNVVQGLYSLLLGTGVGDDIAFTAAMFNGKKPWLEVKVGTETLPRTEITNVPFALISNELCAVGWKNPGEIGKTTPNTGKFTTVETAGMKVTSGAASGKVLTSDAGGNASWQTPSYQSSGTAPGQMQYWNGTAWITVSSGQNGQIMKCKNGVPTWVDDNIQNLSVGEYFQGGIIAYFLQSGDPGYNANVRHGLIAAPGDQSAGSAWGCWGTEITGADGSVLGTGNQNTLDIESGCTTPGTAADICANLILNGYSDWYLPSKDELNKLYLNKNLIGGFTGMYYWSSTEYGSDAAWLQSFYFSDQFFNDKISHYPVRAVRSF